MTKKISTLVLVFCLLFALDAPALSATTSSWARPGITEAIAKGFVPAGIQHDYTSVISAPTDCA
jgi:hypothetical protein